MANFATVITAESFVIKGGYLPVLGCMARYAGSRGDDMLCGYRMAGLTVPVLADNGVVEFSGSPGIHHMAVLAVLNLDGSMFLTEAVALKTVGILADVLMGFNGRDLGCRPLMVCMASQTAVSLQVPGEDPLFFSPGGIIVAFC